MTSPSNCWRELDCTAAQLSMSRDPAQTWPNWHVLDFKACRVELLEDILARTLQAKGRLLVDLINEPDGYSLTWDVSTTPSPLYSKDSRSLKQ